MRRRIDLQAVEDELDAALMNAMMGDPWGRSLQGRLETVSRAVLLRHGLGRAQVRVTGSRETVQVEVILPRTSPQVQRICLRFGGR